MNTPLARATDEAVLHLLQVAELRFPYGVDELRAAYQAAVANSPAAPTFEELVARRWLRPVWRRILTPLNTIGLLRGQPDDVRLPVRAALQRRYEPSFEVDVDACEDPEVEALARQLMQDPPKRGVLRSPSPRWVAARLWDRAPPSVPKGVDEIRWWLDRWDLLGSPELEPGVDWDTESAKRFTDAALAALATDPGFLGWPEVRDHLTARTAFASNRPEAEVKAMVPELPSTLLDRVRWFDGRAFEHVRDDHEACGDLFGIARVLLAEVADVDVSAAPNPLAGPLLDLALQRPELLDFIGLMAHQQPIVLADVLLHPRLTAVAAMWIAEWPPVGSAWDREALRRDDDDARLRAFSDASGVLAGFLQAGKTPPAECGALLAWLHQAAETATIVGRPPAVGPEMLRIFREELLQVPTDLLRAVFNALAPSPERLGGLGSPTFAAAVDVLALGSLAGAVTPGAVVDAYVRSIRSREFSVSASRLDPSGAQALVQLALRASEPLRQQFLAPLDVRATLAAADAAETFSVMDGLARSLRAHIRVLARAVAAWTDAPPAALVAALGSAIRAGALEHSEKGRVPALGARFEARQVYSPNERPIAVDLGEALSTLTGDAREQVLVAVLECDEPLTLAQLLAVVPASVRGRITARIEQLTPENAGRVHSLPEAQARVEALLSARLPNAAAVFFEAETKLQTLGAVPGRWLVRLRDQLRLNLLRKDFQAIHAATPPVGLSPPEEAEANDTLDFYRALARLDAQSPDPRRAKQTFEQLHRRHPDVASYVVNILAAEVGILLAENPFGTLRGEDIVSARRTLADTDTALARCRVVTSEERAAHESNRVLLLLATGEPNRAQGALRAISAGVHAGRLAAYESVALSRMGRPDEAEAVLDGAKAMLGETELVLAARAQLRGTTPVSARAAVASDDDPMPALQEAFGRIIGLDPARLAAVVQAPPDAFESLLTDHVRYAAASVLSLVPMMRDVRVDSCEDDLTALVEALLRSRMAFLRWEVAGQPPGGFTAKGNPGERDLIVRRDSAVLAVLEAVVCDRPVTHAWARDELTSHFQKLLGYDTCRVFFHITYSYVDDPAAVLTELKREARTQAPAGFQFLELADLPDTDSRPPGFVARYQGAIKEARVVFLLLDMKQQAQRDAAKTADATNPRRKKSAPPKRGTKKAAREASAKTDKNASRTTAPKARKQATKRPKATSRGGTSPPRKRK